MLYAELVKYMEKQTLEKQYKIRIEFRIRIIKSKVINVEKSYIIYENNRYMDYTLYMN